ncbi:acetoacetate--CoA ligase [Niveibacterium sp. 24ML]|uniref:acetoacetate--CoA ligase n=1 Tax=Niveibacterium sp. 24ML TaxID=2985512 RepID=UPI00226FC7E0|nr:acetoacetate--CoA ligase [Niveibacterium sp. 24ML]MCX9156015.1 acetoacetate--CoA ligase [Niveibacterium sp. 24ML]
MNDEIAWRPTDAMVREARITAFGTWLAQTRGLQFADYAQMWQWSVDEPDAFWSALWDWSEIRSEAPRGRALVDSKMPGAQWFPGVRLNYVDQVFRHATAARPAIVFRNESGETREVSWAALQAEVAALAASLRAMGIGPGDRVVAYLPNIPETVTAFLAVASLGAVWSICSPDMGRVAVLDRFRQIAPKAMLAVDGYRYAGKAHDRRELLAELLAELPTLEHLILLPQLAADTPPSGLRIVKSWATATQKQAALAPEPVAFDHPLWVVYSSGTTGLPKPIVHGQGGVVIEHVKLAALHLDLGPQDRYHWFSSTGWMMWNAQIAGLLVGATICLYDGSPGYPDLGALWRFAGEARVSFFGAGAAFYASCQKADIHPNALADLSTLRGLGSTGSPLSPENYQWLYDAVRQDIWINPISGGTDIVSAFVGGVPTLPVVSGEMQCRFLGARIEAFDEAGKPLSDEVGELVCTLPLPSMPLYFWNDDAGRRYHDSYFDVYPGIWRHGDWVRITPRGGVVIYGRSDATINRHGIRMGTSELYRAVEDLPEVVDSLVVDLEYLGQESYMPLFVVLREGATLTPELDARIRERIKHALSARHVPNELFQVAAIPRTMSGKKMELPIKKLLMGQPIEKVANPDTMANPESLAWFVDFARRRAQGGDASA